ncbi:hypothetical protein U27_06969 [Candidatus Vecturithrix granuli]|uniref:Uncharacterized protein n=1 Tax=Vecturithrix granuli TaxID=1499967 RepID=A0A081C5X7_VECG1|nr:hypothetical protein U27_06969 [Candidatus Vecturithrix granuli]
MELTLEKFADDIYEIALLLNLGSPSLGLYQQKYSGPLLDTIISKLYKRPFWNWRSCYTVAVEIYPLIHECE